MTSLPVSRWKSLLSTLLKITIVIGIFAWLIHEGHLDLSVLHIPLDAKLIFLFLAILSVFLNMFIQTIRTNLLFHTQNYRIPWWPFYKISWISYFFCTFLPGGVTSDIVKYGYLQRYIQKSRTVTALTILVDRAAGLTALVIISFLASLTALWIFHAQQGVIRDMTAFSALALLGIFFIFYIGFHPKLRNFAAIKRLHRFEFFHSLMDALAAFQDKKTLLLLALTISVLGHTLTLSGIYSLQFLLYDYPPFDFLQILILFPVAMLASVVPIAPQGLGLTQVVIISMVTIMNHPEGTAAVTLFTVMQIVVMLCFLTGAIPYIGYKQTRSPVVPHEQKYKAI